MQLNSGGLGWGRRCGTAKPQVSASLEVCQTCHFNIKICIVYQLLLHLMGRSPQIPHLIPFEKSPNPLHGLHSSHTLS